MRYGWPFPRPPIGKRFIPNTSSQQYKDLIGWWCPLAAPGANMLYDLMRGSNGTLGAATNPSWFTDSAFGPVLEFDGANDVVNVGSLGPLDDISPLTASAWMYPQTLGESSGGRIFDKASGTAPTNGWHFILSNVVADCLTFAVDFSGGLLQVRTAANAITLNTWQHVAVTWDGSLTAANIHIYVNGTETGYAVQTNGSGTRDTDAAQNLLIGNGAAGSRTFDGYLTDLRIYNRVMSAGEIKQLYDIGTRWELYSVYPVFIIGSAPVVVGGSVGLPVVSDGSYSPIFGGMVVR